MANQLLEAHGLAGNSYLDQDLAWLTNPGTTGQPAAWGNDDRFKNAAITLDRDENGLAYKLVEYNPESGLPVKDEKGNIVARNDVNGNPYEWPNYRAMTDGVEAIMNDIYNSPAAKGVDATQEVTATANAANNAILNIASGNITPSTMLELRYLLNDYPAMAGGNFMPSKAPNKEIKNPISANWSDVPGAIQDLQPGAASPENVTYSKTPYEFAKHWLGYSETNVRHNTVLSEAMKKYAGLSISPAQTPWCSAFTNTILNAFGYEGTGKLNARSWLNWGEKISELGDAQEGDIVIFERGNNPNQGHVGFFAGLNENGNPLILGGNQKEEGGDQVSIKAYNKKNLLGIRRAQ
jgi:uncharacterized protein (TIGR02594 family)